MLVLLGAATLGCDLPPSSKTEDGPEAKSAALNKETPDRDRFMGTWQGRADGDRFTIKLTHDDLTLSGSWGSMKPMPYRVKSASGRRMKIAMNMPGEGEIRVDLELSDDGESLTYRDEVDDPIRLKRAKPKATAGTVKRAQIAAADASKGRSGELAEDLARDAIIDVMNDICPDTYCEGEYDWNFKSLSCAAGECKLAFKATHHESGKTFDEKVSFNFSGVPLDSDHVPTAAFDDAMNSAIDKWERKGKR